MANVKTTINFPELEEKCLCCGKELEDEDMELGFCRECQEIFEKE